MGVEMVAHRSAPAAAIEGIAHGAAPAGIGGIDPHFQLAILDVAIEIEIADARLDQRVGVLFVDFEDAVHALQVEDHVPESSGAAPP